VDPQSRADVLIRAGVPALALLGLLAAGCGRGRPEPPPALPAVAGTTIVLRFAAEGGATTAYEPDSLRRVGWASERSLPGLQELLGYAADDQMVFAIDLKGRLVGLDLRTGTARIYAAGVRRATVGPDGAAFVADSSGQIIRIAREATTPFAARFPEPPTALFGAQNGQVVAIRAGDQPEAQLLSAERFGPATPIGSGPVTATTWGDVVAVGSPDGIQLFRTTDGASVRTFDVESDGLVFSPSGHQLYALAGERIRIFDRYSGSSVGTIALPGPGDALRMDGGGRWLLVRAAGADTAWAVDLAEDRLVASVATAWRPDLPLMAGAATLLAADGTDVVAWDLGEAPAQATARAPGGATDLWVSLPWVPLARAADARAAAESARQAQDELLAADSDAPSEGASVWLQVSSSQNPEWAEDLARQVADAGFPTAVWKPATPEEGYRVVVGPFQHREEAEEAGRRLGRPFFVVTGAPRVP
jgi:hypothetical protein